jgi:hypothetical protein|tara:strand:+ start:73745 stop:74485 length:741 start_codon:yes stop_codon:yes gene_type:complete
MAATITFRANEQGEPANNDSVVINHTGAGAAQQGIGFYGLDFGLSVPVGSVQDTTFVTSPDGTDQGIRLNNTAKVTDGDSNVPGTVKVGSSTINLDKLPNYLCPLNIRFNNPDPVRVQECKLRIFSKNSTIDNPASGVTTYVYEARHPASQETVTNLNLRGRSDDSWVEFSPASASVSDMVMTPSPGASGVNTDDQDTDAALGYSSSDGITHVSTQHDWYVALSAEPESIGSKTDYALYFTLEYLS